MARHGTTSWDVENSNLSSFVFCGSNTGSTTLLLSNQICNVHKSSCTDEKCAAAFFRPAMVVNGNVPLSQELREIREVHAGADEGDDGRTK